LGGERKYFYAIAVEQSGTQVRMIFRDVDARANGIIPGEILFHGTRSGDVAEGTVYSRLPNYPSGTNLLGGGRCPPVTAPATVRFDNLGRRIDITFSIPQRNGFTCEPTGRILHSHAILDRIDPPPAMLPPVAVVQRPETSPPKSPPLSADAHPSPPASSSSDGGLLTTLWLIAGFITGGCATAVWFLISRRPLPLPDPLLQPRQAGTPHSPRISDFLPEYPGSIFDAVRGPTESLRARKEFAEESTGLLRAKAHETRALGEVMQERARVAIQLGEYSAFAPLLKHGDPNATSSSVTLTLPEMAETLRIGMPELADEHRAKVISLVRQAMEAKLT
jgi:hypothetical protein